jgi:hypothetical protein
MTITHAVATSQSAAAPVRRRRSPARALLAASLACVAAAAVAQAPPPAAATLSRTEVPAAGRQDAIVNVSAFGRYALTVASSQGTALLFVDRMAGPGPEDGTTGAKDGRLDLLLDRGEYKLVTLGHAKASGTAQLAVHPFRELHAPQPPLLVELKPVDETLADFQQASYWLQIDEPRIVAIEVAGRNLADLRLWRDGTWLDETTPECGNIEPTKGHPMLACRIGARLAAGLYLLTAYGGPGRAWSEDAGRHPLVLRYGIPRLPQAGRQRMTVGPLGYDRFLIPGTTTYFRVELPEARPAELKVGQAEPSRPFQIGQARTATIEKKSVPPAAEVTIPSTPERDHVLTVTAEAGQPYILQQFRASNTYQFDLSGEYWISTVHSGHPEDSVDATVIVARWTHFGQERAAFLDQTVEIDGSHGWARRCNLLDPMTVFLKVGSQGKYEILTEGVSATSRVEPFFTSRPAHYEPPKFRPSGATWDLDPGFYVLTVEPETRGILDIVVRPFGVVTHALELLGKRSEAEQTPLHASAIFPRVSLDRDHSYMVYLNDQPGVRSGVVLRPLPLDLSEALPVTQAPNADVSTSFQALERATLRARDEDGGLLAMSVDGGKPEKEITVDKGEHNVVIHNPEPRTVVYSLGLEPVRLQSSTPLPPIPPATLATLPRFPVLTAAEPLFLDLDRGSATTFLVQADTPALYRLETSGLLATEGNVRTRTVLSLDREAGNGIGRNFLIQQYLRPGDYQLTIRPQGSSAGHLGVALTQTPITDGGMLAAGLAARITLPPGHGVVYRFTIPSRGEYHLRALGLGHDFRCRLEDADGWPIEPPNIQADITRTFEAGTYRLVLLPEGVVTRRVTILEAVPEPLRYTGHGPHALPLDHQVDHVWEEPVEGGERAPDLWEFSLPAAVPARIDLSGEMEGQLARIDHESASNVASLPPGKGWAGELAAGRYRLAVVCSRHDNQVAYHVSVRPGPLVTGLSREIDVPGVVAVAAGRDGLVELSSFGSADVRGVLVGPQGEAIASNDDRPDDWNFHIAAHLERGAYTLRVMPVGSARARCVISMRTPEEIVDTALAVPGRRDVDTGRAAHLIPLQLPEDVQFLAASVRSAESVGCAIEAAHGSSWRPLATRIGRDVRLELPLTPLASPATPPALRVRVWSVDQRGLSARLVVAAVRLPVVGESALRGGADLPPVEGSDPQIGALAVNVDHPGLFLLSDPDVRASAAAGTPAEPSAGDPIAATGASVFLVGDLPARGRLTVRANRLVVEPGAGLAARVPVGETIVCDLGGERPRIVMALAKSMRGQPGVNVFDRAVTAADKALASGAMAVGQHGAVAVAIGVRAAAAAVWQAEPSVEPLDVRVQQVAYLQQQPEAATWGLVSGELIDRDHCIFQLPEGLKRLELAVGEGVVAVLAGPEGVESVHWDGGRPFAERLESRAAQLIILRAEGESGAFAVSVLPSSSADRSLALDPDRLFESAEMNAGILRLAVPRLSGSSDHAIRIHVRGARDAMLLTDTGAVSRGTDLTANGTPGTLLVHHDKGRLLCWVEAPGGLSEALWGLIQDIRASTVAVPAVLPLRGKAMTLRIDLGHAAMLHLRSATPLAIRLVRPTGEPEVEMDPDGCLLDAYLPGGTAELAVRPLSALELAGTADLTSTPITAVDEGLGPELLLAPGETRAFSFTVAREGPVGVGVRADSDVVTCTLLDSEGRWLGSGVVQMTHLTPGTYVLALHAPPSVAPVRVRPAVVGIHRPDTGPPDDVIRKYLQEMTARETGGAR